MSILSIFTILLSIGLAIGYGYPSYGGGFGGFGDYNDRFDQGQEYEILDDFEHVQLPLNLSPLIKAHAKPCNQNTPEDQCRPFYLPCLDDDSCAVSCRVNNWGCGRCSDNNNGRQYCKCCIPLMPIIRR